MGCLFAVAGVIDRAKSEGEEVAVQMEGRGMMREVVVFGIEEQIEF